MSFINTLALLIGAQIQTVNENLNHRVRSRKYGIGPERLGAITVSRQMAWLGPIFPSTHESKEPPNHYDQGNARVGRRKYYAASSLP